MGESKVIDVEFDTEDETPTDKPPAEPHSVMDTIANVLSGFADSVEQYVPGEDGKELAEEVRRCSSAVVSARDGAHKLKDAYEKVSKVAGKINEVRGTPFIHRRF